MKTGDDEVTSVLCNQGDVYWWTVVTQGGTGGFEPKEGVSQRPSLGTESSQRGIGLPPVWELRRGGVSCRTPPCCLLSPFSPPPSKKGRGKFFSSPTDSNRNWKSLSVCYSETFLWPQTLPSRLDIIMKVAEIQKESKPQTWHMKRLLSSSCIW